MFLLKAEQLKRYEKEKVGAVFPPAVAPKLLFMTENSKVQLKRRGWRSVS